ncbi:MAG: hypothetical protein ACLTDS_06790 [Bianqueaceae bacterium]
MALYVLPLYLIVNSWGVYMGTGRAIEVHTGLEADSKRAKSGDSGNLIGFLLFVCSIQLPESLGRVVEMTGT